MSEHIVNIDLTGLELSNKEAARISQIAHDAVMAEVAKLSKAKGQGAAIGNALPGRPHVIGLVAVARLEK